MRRTIGILAAAWLAASAAWAQTASISVTKLESGNVAVQVEDAKVADVARELARVGGARVDGIEHLADVPVILRFEDIPLFAALQLLAGEGKTMVLRSDVDEQHYAFAPPDFMQRLEAAEAAVDRAGQADDDAALDAAIEALVALARPKRGAPGIDPEGLVEGRVYAASERKDFAAAERLQRRHMAMIEQRVGGQTGAEYALALAEVARLRGKQEDEQGALALTERALEIAQAQLGPVHPDLASMQVTLAYARQAQDRNADAEKLLLAAIEGYEASDNDVEFELALALEGLGWMYMADRRDNLALPLFERNLEIVSRKFPLEEAFIARAGEALAAALIGNDRLHRAVPLLERAIAAREDSPEKKRLQDQLDAISALGTFAADGAPVDAAPARLREALARGLSEDVRAEMDIMMLRRAVLRHRASPQGSDWKNACEARAELLLAARDEPPADVADYVAFAQRTCESEVLGAR